jgi:type II secretory pathway pseudopilin PulG
VRRSHAAFTLVEILIASTLFALVLGMVTLLYLHTSERSERGMLKIEAQRVARTLVDSIARDLKQSAILPLNTTGMLPIPSAVAYPDSYSHANNSSGPGAGTLVFSRPVEGTEDAGDINNFVWVQYSKSAGLNGATRIVRRTFDIDDATSPTGVRGLTYQNRWYFSPAALDGVLPREERVIAVLPSRGDTLTLTVSHKKLQTPDYQYAIEYDRSLYRILVEVSLSAGGNQNRRETQSYETQATLVI